jgi:hypothetical protein
MLIKLSQSTLSKIKNELNITPSGEAPNPEDFRYNLEEVLDDDFKYLGQGGYNVVYEKNNLIFKFTKNKSDVLKAKLLHELANKMPEEYQRYIMYIDDTGSFNLEGDIIYYVATEKLFPLTNREITELFNIKRENKELNKKKYLPNVFKAVINTDNFNEIINLFIKNLLDNSKTEEIDQLKYNRAGQTMKDNIIKEFDEIDSEFTIDLDNDVIFANIVSEEFDKLNIKYDADFKYELRDMFTNKRQDIPLDYSHIYFNNKNKEFVRFLKYLKTNFNIESADLHFGNIMKRKNGDLVLSDVGLFRIN